MQWSATYSLNFLARSFVTTDTPMFDRQIVYDTLNFDEFQKPFRKNSGPQQRRPQQQPLRQQPPVIPHKIRQQQREIRKRRPQQAPRCMC